MIGCCNYIMCLLTTAFNSEISDEENFLVLPHPPYRPGLVMYIFYLFPKLKPESKGHYYGTGKSTKNCDLQAKHTYRTLLSLLL